MTCPFAQPNRRATGFTVVEMMIVISLLAILVSIVIVAMSRVQLSAQRTETTSTLRHMVGGYNAYSQDHRNRLMPGYLDQQYIQDLRINAERPDGTRFIRDFDDAGEPYEDISSYVWRLAPYLDFDWHAMLADYPSGRTISRLESDLIGDDPVYGPSSFGGDFNDASVRAISMVPSIGLNSIFLGGDTRHGGTYANERHPWHNDVIDGTTEKLAATRYTEVRNPAQVIVFAPTGRAATGGNETYITPNWTDHPIGYPELRAPFLQRVNGVWIAESRQWRVGRYKEIDRRVTGEYGEGAGLPIMRWGTGVMPVAHLDGSATVEDIELLSTDMRRWAPDETGMVAPEIQLE